MGLVLFGTNADHCSFMVQDRLEKCTSCHLMTSVCQGPLPAAGCLKTGQPLETLTHLAVIQASRMGGLTGCSVMEFIAGLVREFSPMPEVHSVMAKSKVHVLPKLPSFDRLSENLLPGHVIPLLSPMAAVSWNKDLFKCLSAVIGGARRLAVGVYKQTLKNDPVDGVAFYQDNPDDSLTVPLDEKSHLDILRAAGYVPKETCVNLPRYAKCFALKPPSALPRAAFVVECKQYSDPLTPSLVEEVLFKKFAHHPQCSLFFIVALGFSVGVESGMSYPGYKFYMVKKTGPDVIELRRTTESQDGRRATKCVILVSLEEIWGSRFKELCGLLNLAEL
jgi:hypothetical protein